MLRSPWPRLSVVSRRTFPRLRLRTIPLLVATLLTPLVAGSPRQAAVGADLEAAKIAATARSTIRAVDVKRHTDVLASDTFEGREAGSRGGRAAGVYLIEQMRAIGVRPAGIDGGYAQEFGRNYRNLLARIEGSDPELRHQHVLVGGHYDHVGYGNATNSNGPYGRIHNGADDNASGTSAVLELAQAFASLPVPPKRSVLFALWDAEEVGLLGSEHWVRQPTVPLASVKLAVNLDMVGRMKEGRIVVYGTRTAPGLRLLASRAFSAVPDRTSWLEFDWDVAQDSDHWSFYARRVPFLMFYTDKHEDYHRPSDDVDKLNLDGATDVTRLVFDVLIEAANAPALPGFRAASHQENESVRRRNEAPLPPPASRLGLYWDAALAAKGELEVTGFVPNSAAERDGLRRGDRLLACDGRPVTGTVEFRRTILAARAPVVFRVARPGSDGDKEFPVKLDGSPIRFGFSWREDDAEPGTVQVTQIIAGSPAEEAGLRVADRIVEADGQPFESGAAFRAKLDAARIRLALRIERRGRFAEHALVPLGSDLPTEPTP